MVDPTQAITEKRRTILVVDDEFINREVLKMVLEDHYDVLLAENGREALDVIRAHRNSLSVVLLDINMPGLSGFEVLEIMKADPLLKELPVIVVTGDPEFEVKSLNQGAADYIPKPFPKADIILARVAHTIEYAEDREMIAHTERDTVTGLYNRSYFYHHAELFDQHHDDEETDAIIVDVNHFRMINERFGTAVGDATLLQLSQSIRAAVKDSGGIVCRREADTFMVYCPHVEDYQALLEEISGGVNAVSAERGGVRLRMGVYPCTDKEMDIERRFDRASMAADTVRGSFTHVIGVYDSELHAKELYAERLIDEFERAINEKQFVVYYQPKFDIRPEIPVLASAEALVRWKHPELGLISPGVFIPLFEENGLIQTLDRYVWREAAEQIRSWKERFGFSVPVSVNVSRVDLYDPFLTQVLQGIVAENGLSCAELLLEITESAYTQNSAQIISVVSNLRSLGFQIEMDDFGTGYSSLSVIAELPLDALKLDMKFIRSAFNDRHDTRMLEVSIDIAETLGVPIIAEGVETREQLATLKALGCDIVQGYYFARPMPANDCDSYVETRRDQHVAEFSARAKRREATIATVESAYGRIAYALSSGYKTIYYVNAQDGHYVMFGAEGAFEDLQIQGSGDDFFADCKGWISKIIAEEEREELTWTMNRERLLFVLDEQKALTVDFHLLEDGKPELHRMKIISVMDNGERFIIMGLSNVEEQDRRERELDAERKNIATFSGIARALAQDYFCIYYVNAETDRFIEYDCDDLYEEFGFEKSGDHFFDFIRKNANRVVYHEDREAFLAAFTRENVLRSLHANKTFTLTFRLLFSGKPTYVSMKVTRMGTEDVDHLIIGVNNVDAEVKREQEYTRKLLNAREMANRDALTGVKSKHAYAEMESQLNTLIAEREADPFSIVFCDINNLKEVNDTQGHQAGDAYIKEASALICNIFKRSPVFRIGGDEFVVIAYGHDNEVIDRLMVELRARIETNRTSGGVLLASGIASFDPAQDSCVQDVFERADRNMYENKKALKDE